jgi:hypothetical protein
MAQPDGFKLIKQIVVAGGHKQMTGKLDRRRRRQKTVRK